MGKDFSDGSPLQSKKFIAYLIAEISWKIMAGLFMYLGHDTMEGKMFMVLMAIIITAGFIEVGFILGQAYIDKYVRVASIVTNGKDPTPPKKEDA